MSMKDIITKYVKQLVNEGKGGGTITAYHGSEHDNIQGLNADFMGAGNDTYGVGMYWSNDPDLARSYGHYIYTAELKLNRIVPMNRRLTDMQIQGFIKQSPDFERTIENFDENPNRALHLAVRAMADGGDNAAEQLQCIWYDFYRNYVPDYIHMISKYFDGTVVPVNNGVIFYIVYNSASLRIINMQTAAEFDAQALQNGVN